MYDFMLWLRVQSLALLLCKRLCDIYVLGDEAKKDDSYRHWMALRAIVYQLEKSHALTVIDFREIEEAVAWMNAHDERVGDVNDRLMRVAKDLLDLKFTEGAA